MRKNKKLILISSILATTAIAVVPALSIVNNINSVNVIDSQLDNVVLNSQQVESSVIMTINSNECNVGSTKATEWMGITSGGLVNFEIDDAGLTATVKNVSATTIASTYLKIPGSITYNGKAYTVTSIGNRAFLTCSKLTGTLTIPTSVNTIDEHAFENCSGLDGLDLSNATSLKTIGEASFADCSELTDTLTIPASVTTIGTGAFSSCTNLATLDLTNAASLTDIGGTAFIFCSGLTGILTIPASVTTIGTGAFAFCTSITNIIVLSSVISIGSIAFSACSSITDITILATTPPTVQDDSFDNNAVTLYVPADSEYAYKSHPVWGKFNIQLIPNPPRPDPQPTFGFPWWAILVIIGATTIVVGTLTIAIVTIKRKNNEK